LLGTLRIVFFFSFFFPLFLGFCCLQGVVKDAPTVTKTVAKPGLMQVFLGAISNALITIQIAQTV
jgi:hypothetical protein